jgi:competence protein ComEC
MLRRRALWLVLLFLLVANAALYAALHFARPKELSVSFLDVGQGDAVLIESPGGADILIDGGRDRSVLRGLGRELGLFDRSLDMVIATHPDSDHIGGLAGVFSRYRVGAYLDPGIESGTNAKAALESAVSSERGVKTYEARRGMRIRLDDGVRMDILFPDRDVSLVETNTGSVVLRLVYGDTSFMLTGDAPSAIESWLVALDGENLKSDVLKAGHHGSRTSSGDEWLAAVDPSVVVVSAGKDNSYGHPHEEAVARILESGATIVSTAEEGTITFLSDGKDVVKR